jgi:hypothetical protein
MDFMSYGIEAISARTFAKSSSVSGPPSSTQTLSELNKDQEAARKIVTDAKTKSGHDVSKVADALEKSTDANPEIAGKIRENVISQLSPKEKGELERIEKARFDAVIANFKNLSVDKQLALVEKLKTAPPGTVERQHFDQLSRLWTRNPAMIAAGLDKLSSNNLTLGSAEKQQAKLEAVLKEIEKESAAAKNVLFDIAQIGLDIAGIFDPSGVADGANAVISLFRGDFKGAILSGISVLPGADIAAKLGKSTKWLKTMERAVELIEKSPKLAKLLLPALEKLGGVLNTLSEVFNGKLPDNIQKIQATLDKLSNLRDIKNTGVDVVTLNEAQNKRPSLDAQLAQIVEEINRDWGVSQPEQPKLEKTPTAPPPGTTIPSQNKG